MFWFGFVGVIFLMGFAGLRFVMHGDVWVVDGGLCDANGRSGAGGEEKEHGKREIFKGMFMSLCG